MTSNSFDSRDMSDLFGVKVCFSDQMILDITKHQAVLPILINEMTHALCVVELCLTETPFRVTDGSCSDLFNELLSVCVED